MLKLLTRIVALLLVPCLLMDPLTASPSQPFSKNYSILQNNACFEYEAFAIRVRSVPQRLSHDSASRLWRMIVASWNRIPGYSHFATTTQMGIPLIPPESGSSATSVLAE